MSEDRCSVEQGDASSHKSDISDIVDIEKGVDESSPLLPKDTIDNDINNDNNNDKRLVLSKTFYFWLILISSTVSSCTTFLLTYEAYIIDDIGMSVDEFSWVVNAKTIGGSIAFIFPLLLSKMDKYTSLTVRYNIILPLLYAFVGILVFSYRT